MEIATSSALGLSGNFSFRYSTREFTIRLDPKVASPNYYTDILIEHLKSLNLEGKVVLDAGSGTGIISLLALTVLNAAFVWAIDIDADAIALTRENCLRNGCDLSRIHFIQADIREFDPPETLDVVIANPPQIPTPDVACGPCSGGVTGREVMEALLQFSSRALGSGGFLIMTAADFVGTQELICFSSKLGLNATTIATRICEPGPYTIRFRRHIEREGYKFHESNDKPCFNLNLMIFGVR